MGPSDLDAWDVLPLAAGSKTWCPALYRSAMAGRGAFAVAGAPSGGAAGGSGGIGKAAACAAPPCSSATSLAAAPTSTIGLVGSARSQKIHSQDTRRLQPLHVHLHEVAPYFR